MDDKITEIKAVLRSILISSTVVINVVELNRDFKELMGSGIPFKDLGYDSLLGFLNSIPDVLRVNGNSSYSDVYLIESEKSAHVSNLVLRQKTSKKPGAFHSNIKSGRRNSANPPRFKKNSFPIQTSSRQQFQNEKSNATAVTKPKNQESSYTSICDKNKSRNSTNTSEQKNNQSEVIDKIPGNSALSIDSKNSEQRLISENKKNLENTEQKNDKSLNESTTLLRRIDYKNESSPKIDLPLKDTAIFENSRINLEVSSKTKVKNTDNCSERTTSSRLTKNIDERPCEEERLRNSEKYIKSSSNMASSNNIKRLLPNLNSGSLRNSNPRNKPEKWKTQSLRSSTDKSTNTKLPQRQNGVPKQVENNLHQLISSFPEGLWCSELPTVYKNLYGQELDFERYGYMCLNHLCFDLEHIFHCIRESSCDYKIYDARKPRPEINVSLQGSTQTQSNEDSIVTDLPPAVPEITWSGYECFLPAGAVKLGHRMEKIQVADIFRVGTSVKVVVAEIYDISKFWIYLDDSKLDSLMSAMQSFYEINKQYLLPTPLLAEGLNCVVLYHSKFHRAVILNVLPNEDYIKVYYFDFGTLGTVSKSEVWFLTKEFSELPCQAIRARIVDVYPPYQGVTWSPFANYDFSRFTCMKKLNAEICRIDEQKNLLDIQLKNAHGTSISDILVDEKHALFINTPPKKRTDDPNCECKVRFIHLFPTFEEIEHWIVPSMEEAANFLNTTVTADFLFSQYFTRKVDTNLLESVEEKMKLISRKKKALTKSVKSEDVVLFHSTEEMNKIAYGQLYDPSMAETEAGNEVQERSLEVQSEVDSKNNSWVYMEDDETFARKLRQSRMKKVCSVEEETEVNGSSKKVESTSWQKSNSRPSMELSTLSELEKYLSEESSSKDPSKKSTPNLIDLDNAYPISLDSSTNLLLGTEFEQSMSDLANSRRKCGKCLLTESSSDMESGAVINPLDFPIPISLENNPISLDLIQFDEEESTIGKTSGYDSRQGIHSTDNKSIFNTHSEELSDADDEDSDSKQNSSKLPNVRLKEYKKKIQHVPTETKIDFDVSHFNKSKSSNIGVTTDLTIQEIPDILNIPDLAYSTNIHDHHISDDKTSYQINNLVNSESIITELNGEYTLEDSVETNSIEFCNLKTLKEPGVETRIDKTLTEFNSENNDSNLEDFKSFNHKLNEHCGLENLIDCQITNEKPSPNSFKKSVDSNDYLQFNGDNLLHSKDLGNMNIPDTSSSNLYYSCESKESSIGNSYSEDSLEFSKFDTDDDVVNASTPLSLQKDRSFLEEFDIIDTSPTVCTNSNERSNAVTPSLNALAEEFVKLEVPTSHPDTKEVTSDDSKTVIVKNSAQNDCSDMDLENTLTSSVEIIDKSNLGSVKDSETSSLPKLLTLSVTDNPPDITLSPDSAPGPQPPYAPNYMEPPRMLVRGPPPGFPPFPMGGFPRNPPPGFPLHPSPGYPRVLAPPNSLRYPNRFIPPPNIPFHCITTQQQDIFGAAQYYGVQPIVILNYNFIPPQNQNENS